MIRNSFELTFEDKTIKDRLFTNICGWIFCELIFKDQFFAEAKCQSEDH